MRSVLGPKLYLLAQLVGLTLTLCVSLGLVPQDLELLYLVKMATIIS